jgi:hypothetical protein
MEEIRNAIPFNMEQDWVLMKSNGYEGFLFLINPNYKQVNRTIVFDGKLNLIKPEEHGYWLIKEIYPQERFIWVIDYNLNLTFLLDGQSVTVYQLIFVSIFPQPSDEIFLLGFSGQAFLEDPTILRIDGVYGEAGTQTKYPMIVLPTAEQISKVYLNGIEKEFQQDHQLVSLNDPIIFPGLYLPRSAEVFNNTIIVSDLLLEQFQNRKSEYPIDWTEKELNDASWLGPHRLLLFICILNPNDQWKITGQINSNPVIIHKAYNTRDHYDGGRFMGFYIDLTSIVTQANVEYHLSLDIPQLKPGQYQGLFLENIERIFIEPL